MRELLHNLKINVTTMANVVDYLLLNLDQALFLAFFVVS